MPSLTVKSVPEELLNRLRESARAHHRSLNGEVLACLERALGARAIDPLELSAHIDAWQARVGLPPLSDEEITKAKWAGRP